MSFQQEQICLREGANALAAEPLKQKQQRLNERMQALKEVKEKILRLEERHMNNEIETSTYQTWFKKFKEEQAVLELSIKPKEKQILKADSVIDRVLPSLSNVFGIYDVCNIYQKHAIVRGLFKDNLAYGGGAFRTN